MSTPPVAGTVLLKACHKADRVVVYAFGHAAEVWWKGIASKLTRLDNVQVWRVPFEAVGLLAGLAERTMQLQATVQEAALTLGNAQRSVHLESVPWR
jgi:uncharacterized protein YaeQ